MNVHAVTVVVVNHNGGPLLARCLDDLVAQRVRSVVVIDNASEDDSWRAAEREGVTLVRSLVNLGFARGVNAALARTDDPYVLLLNADVVLGDGYVGRLVEALEHDASVASATGLLVLPQGVTDSSGVELTRARWAADRDRGTSPAAVVERDPFGVSGAAGLFRRSALEEVARGRGALWEALFVYWEDVELAWRLRRAGWRTAFVPVATAEHQRGSDAADPTFVEAANLRGRLATVARHEGWLGLLRPGALAVTLLVIVRVAVRHPSALLAAHPLHSVRAGLAARRSDAGAGWPDLPAAAFSPHPWRGWFLAQVSGSRAGTGSIPGRSRTPTRHTPRLVRRREDRH